MYIKIINDQDKRKLVEAEGVTLDGQPARIMGVRLDFPWVVREDGVGFEYSWATVHRIVTTLGGRFTS